MNYTQLQPIYTTNHTESVDDKLKYLLSTIRKHLDMEVAFISEFVDGKRVFRFVDTESATSSLKAGDSDPLEETYCKRIADHELDEIIHNTRTNTITNGLDVTTRLSIGCYMGVPLLLSSGTTYGTFCCFRREPDETLNLRDLSFLRAIAEIAVKLIESHISLDMSLNEARERVQSILAKRNLKIHYQPIYNLSSNTISGYESLSRFDTTPYRTPDVWFSEAAQTGLGQELEILAITSAIDGLPVFDDSVYISVNASPDYILNGSIYPVLNHIEAKRIVLEITEHSPILDYAEFRESLKPLRDIGIRLAIDDAGAGFSSFKHIIEIEPDIIKLDIGITRMIHQDRKRRLLAQALCTFAKAVGCTIVAEGVETVEELNTLRELGVDNAQGYLLGRPMPMSEAASWTADIG